MIVDCLRKRTPRNSTEFYTGSCVMKSDPSKIMSLRMTEPPEAIGEVLKMSENQFCMMTNVNISTEAVRSTTQTAESIIKCNNITK